LQPIVLREKLSVRPDRLRRAECSARSTLDWMQDRCPEETRAKGATMSRQTSLCSTSITSRPMKRRFLILVTAALLLFGGSALASSVASAPASVEPGGGGMVCNSDRNGVLGWIFNYGHGGYSWHICHYGGAGVNGYWDEFYAAWIRTYVNGPGYYWSTNRWHWCFYWDCVV
jgi:hypothetical protein